jgi:hypothetical protein
MRRLIGAQKTEIKGIPFILRRGFVTIAKVTEEWLYDVEQPGDVIDELKSWRPRVDIITIKQRIPNFRKKYPFLFEWENSAVLTIANYDDWFNNQLAPNSRNKLRIAEKKGVTVKKCLFCDELIGNILKIYNETKIRQGKKFQHYNIDFGSLKKAHSTFLERSVFLGAFLNEELIGFVKLVDAGGFIRTMGILAKVKHRDKAPMNILISEAVKYCAENNVKYFVYGKYDYGNVGSDSIRDFKRFNGFEGVLLPRYYVPITIKGKEYLKLNLHHGIISFIPKRAIRFFLEARKFYYLRYVNANSDSV